MPSGSNSYSNAINSFGVVTGELGNSSTNLYHGFIYNRGELTTFEPPGAFVCATTSINDLGQIVGNFSPIGTSITNGLNENDHVFLRQPNGTFEDFGNFGSDPYPLINDQGVIVINALNGSATSGYSYLQAFVRSRAAPNLLYKPTRPEKVLALAARYDVELDFSSIPHLIKEHGVTFSGCRWSRK